LRNNGRARAVTVWRDDVIRGDGRARWNEDCSTTRGARGLPEGQSSRLLFYHSIQAQYSACGGSILRNAATTIITIQQFLAVGLYSAGVCVCVAAQDKGRKTLKINRWIFVIPRRC
jgi:hypothetical protein